MKDETRAKLLRVVLIVTGAIFCLAGAGLVIPCSWLRAMGGWFVGVEVVDSLWPDGALFEYALRASFVAWLWLGVVLLVAASNPAKHRAEIDVAIGGLFLLAAVCLVTGLVKGLPLFWPLGDAIPSLVGAALLLVLRPRASEG